MEIKKMKEFQKKKEELMYLLNLYAQYEFVNIDTAGKASLEAIIKGKEDNFVKLLKEERNEN